MLHFRFATRTTLLAALQLSYAASAIAQSSDPQAPAPTWPTKAWETSTAEEQGMDSAKLALLVEAVGSRKQDSLMVIRHGKVVAEVYYAPYVAGVPHDLRSVTKSIISTLTAIELQNGLLDSVDHSVVELFSEKNILNADTDERRKSIKVQNLLDMNSGIKWKERAYTPDETIMQMYGSPDRVQFVLNQPMSDAPGAKFYYNSGNPYVLSALINKKAGQNAFEFAKKELFAPLGITSAWWRPVDAQGITDGESGLFLTPQDMARVGYLYLHNGLWEDKQIIPASWVERARKGEIEATGGLHYANLWWSVPEKGAFMALGRHSQMIIVLPKLDVVAVMTGSMPDGEYYSVFRLIDDISDAVKSSQPLQSDPVAQSLLAASIHKAATEGRPSAVTSAPELAKAISGKTYQLSYNPLHVKAITLDFSGPDCIWKTTIDPGEPDQPLIVSEGHVGLDGTFKNGPPAQSGPSTATAAKGRWLNNHTFEVERQILGHGETQIVQLAFSGDGVEVSYRDTDGSRGSAFGKAAE